MTAQLSDNYNTSKYYVSNLLSKSPNYIRIKEEESLGGIKYNKFFFFIDLSNVLGRNKVFNGDSHHAKVLRELIIKIINFKINKVDKSDNIYFYFSFVTKKNSAISSNYSYQNSENELLPIPIELDCEDLTEESVKYINFIDINLTYCYINRNSLIEKKKKKMDLFKSENFSNDDNTNFDNLVSNLPSENDMNNIINFENFHCFIKDNKHLSFPTDDYFSYLKPIFEKLHAITSLDDITLIRRYCLFKLELGDDNNTFEILSGDRFAISDISSHGVNKTKHHELSETTYMFNGNNNNLNEKDNIIYINNLINDFNNSNLDIINGMERWAINTVIDMCKNGYYINDINYIVQKNDMKLDYNNNNIGILDENNLQLFNDIKRCVKITNHFCKKDILKKIFDIHALPIEEHIVSYVLENESNEYKFKVLRLNDASENIKIYNCIYLNNLTLPKSFEF